MAVPPPHPAPPSPDKAALRATLRRERKEFAAGLSDAARAEALAAIDRRLAPLLKKGGPLSGYVAQQGETDVLPFLLRAFHLGKAIALPHLTAGSRQMCFTAWLPDALLAPGPSGIPQPGEADSALEPAIVLTPLVGFDRAGNRLGQGGGYYDRWFADHPRAMRIGIAWSMQEIAALAPDPWDMPLHAIVTEKEWIEP